MAEPKTNELMEKLVSLCKRRGFVFQSSEIYGGINGFWDYGPLGAELKRNVKELWWRRMVHFREDVAGLEATIIMHPNIWRASGHVETFADLMRECPLTRKRFRADQVDTLSGTVYHYDGGVDAGILGNPIQVEVANYLKTLGPTKTADISQEKFEEIVHLFLKSPETAASAIKTYGETLRFTPFAVLVPAGKPPESARKVAAQFYSQLGIENCTLLGERIEKVENSQDYNPENGALLTAARPFNLMFKTYVGPVADEDHVAYLRPETAQAIFAQFKNVLETSRQKVPFGIGQIGKAFRNEVTPRNFTFRSREFEQMELEFFIKPDEAVEICTGKVEAVGGAAHPGEPQPSWGWEVWHKYWVEERISFYESIGLPRTTLEEYWQKPEELAHYAKATVDLLFKFPFGTQELEGIAARGDFDLSQHQKHSGKSMEYFDDELKVAWSKLDDAKKQELLQRNTAARLGALLKKGVAEADATVQAAQEAKAYFDKLARGSYVPHVIEPSAGVDRLILALIANAYAEEEVTDEKGNKETRTVMKFHPRVAPLKVGIFPLLKNRPELVKKAIEVRDALRPHMTVFYDEAGAIGRRYRRQDEAGTPYGVTIDFDTLGEKGPELADTVTLRDRDTMKQERIKIADLLPFLLSKIR